MSMDDDFTWFKKHYTEFQNKYGNAFIVVKNKKILGIYKSCVEAIRNTEKTEKLGTFIVQECNTQYKAYCGYISSTNFM